MHKDLIAKKIIDHNKIHNLEFDKINHKYYVNKEECISVTTKIQKYFPFKKEKISKIVAEKTMSTQYEIEDEWNLLAKIGSLTHELIDDYIKGKCTDKTNNFIQGALLFLRDNPDFEVIASEIQIFSHKYKTAGTIDLIVKDIKTKKIYTIDWKTSQKPISKTEYWEMGKTPFDTIPNNKFYKYSLQLWIYNLILKDEYGIDVWDSYIIHINNNIKASYDKICPCSMIFEAEELLNINNGTNNLN